MGLRDRFQLLLLDWVMGPFDKLRPRVLEAAEGDVLEVGFGTGRNLPHYPVDRVRSLTALDPLPPLLGRIHQRLAQAPFPVEQVELRADRELPFERARFDCIVTTWTLCSIPEVVMALEEMRRVLKPGGRYVFIEHGRSPSTTTARVQDALNPAWRRLSGGCNMNRPIDELVRKGGFELERLARFRVRGPRILSEMYHGIARPRP